MNDESIPYRTGMPHQVIDVESQRPSRDEDNYDTLKIVYRALKDAIEDLDKWHAFDLGEKELNIKQQIKAHQLAYETLAPLLDTVETAVQKVDSKYKER